MCIQTAASSGRDSDSPYRRRSRGEAGPIPAKTLLVAPPPHRPNRKTLPRQRRRRRQARRPLPPAPRRTKLMRSSWLQLRFGARAIRLLTAGAWYELVGEGTRCALKDRATETRVVPVAHEHAVGRSGESQGYARDSSGHMDQCSARPPKEPIQGVLVVGVSHASSAASKSKTPFRACLSNERAMCTAVKPWGSRWRSTK